MQIVLGGVGVLTTFVGAVLVHRDLVYFLLGQALAVVLCGIEVDFSEGLFGLDVLIPDYSLPPEDVDVNDVCGVPNQISKLAPHVDDLVNLGRQASQVYRLEYIHREHSVKSGMAQSSTTFGCPGARRPVRTGPYMLISWMPFV